MSTLLLLCGLPAAGKTTLAEEVKRCVDRCNANVSPLLCPFRACVHVEFDNLYTCDDDFHSLRERAKAAVEDALCKSRTLVICDDNNFYKSMRKEFRHIASRLAVRYLEVFVDVDVDLAVSRNAMRLHRYLPITEETIRNMHAKFDLPKLGLRLDGTEVTQINAQRVYQACQQHSPPSSPKHTHEPDQLELQRRQRVREAVLQAKARGVTGKQLNRIANVITTTPLYINDH